MKFVNILIYFFLLNFMIYFTENKTILDSKSAISIIQEDLDSLISQLKSKNLSTINLDQNEQNDFLLQGKKVNLKDEIINAFQDLNNDFQGYQEILNGNSKSNKTSFSLSHLEENLNKTMSNN